MSSVSQSEVSKLVQAIVDRAPSYEANGKNYFVLERCISVEESSLKSYVEGTLAPLNSENEGSTPLELVGATINGKLMRWKPDMQLTWKLELASFPSDSHREKCLEFTQAACSDWNAAAEQGGIGIRFVEVEPTQPSLFRIAYEGFGNPNLFAVAFFPNEPEWGRTVRVGPAMFAPNSTFDPVGVMRHELGHVLGFRHEHIRPEAPQHIEPWVVGEIGAQELNAYDRRSLMHYPMGNAGTNDFKITDHDRNGFIKLYTLSPNSVQEYEA